jgi:hypothetical protein
MKRKLVLVLIGLLTLPVGAGAFFYFTSDAINPTNCAKIKEGMKKDQVEALLGGPASTTWAHPAIEPPPNITQEWHGNWGIITVEFDYNDQDVVAAPAVYSAHESLVAKLRKRLGW